MDKINELIVHNLGGDETNRLIANSSEKANIVMQLVHFRNKESFFGLQQTKDIVARHSPYNSYISNILSEIRLYPPYFKHINSYDTYFFQL
ncbi:hypothetical protein M5K25_010155 [Dendrobium thyrsiflorum]|uniref:Uncharacterized protein n=1 Tax=Dendrobium thyrsiflorum TaxID=117978 RepID=A0ABD0V611_DENTH